MASGNEPLTTTGYISHHLQNLVCGFGENGLECGGAEIAEKYGFWAFHMCANSGFLSTIEGKN